MSNDSGRGVVSGYTLVELMIVLALAAVLVSFAVPAWNGWRMRERVEARAQALLDALAQARAESMRRGTRLMFCRSDAAARCLPAGTPCASGARDWSCGWVLRVAGQAGPMRVFAPDEQIEASGVTTALTFVPPAGQVVGGFRHFEFGLPDEPAAARRCVLLAAGGRARLVRGPCEARGHSLLEATFALALFVVIVLGALTAHQTMIRAVRDAAERERAVWMTDAKLEAARADFAGFASDGGSGWQAGGYRQ